MDTPTPQPLAEAPMRTATCSFSGTRGNLLSILLRGFLLFIPTLGIYRFWLLTQKRHFYWSHTKIDGDPLEYTGTPVQLLVGFLFALIFFVPIYGLLFYFGLQETAGAVVGTFVVLIVFYFLIFYATYRSRRYRLSRTLWRGIRFHQTGSARIYAFKAMGWSVLMVLTLGLVYPFMTASLWRYRYDNFWFGDRKFSFSGSWKTIAKPFYLTYGLGAVILVVAGFLLFHLGQAAAASLPNAQLEGEMAGLFTEHGFWNLLPLFMSALAALIIYFGYIFISSRVQTRFWSGLSLGKAQLAVTIRFRYLLGMHILYVLFFVVVLVIGFIVGFSFITSVAQSLGEDQLSIYLLYAISILGYLIILAMINLVGELVLRVGYWKLVAHNATILDSGDLDVVKAAGEEYSPVGEGLADALDIGAY